MNIGIAGAGILGRLFALACLQQGWRVTIFDKEARANTTTCSYVAAGMLAPYSEMDRGDLTVHNYGVKSIALWPKILSSLTKPVYFQQAGGISLAHKQDMPELERFEANIRRRLDNSEPIIRLNSAALRELEPDLTLPFAMGLHLPLEGQIANWEVLSALEQTLLEKGANWYENTELIEVKSHELKTATTSYKFDLVFDARGVGAKQDMPGLRGVRGELIWLYAPTVNINRPLRLLHPRHPVYIVPRPGNIYVVGASMLESEDLSPISVHSLMELLAAAYSVHTGFDEARIIKTLTQCRPAFPDNLPKIFWEKGLIRVNGLFRHGYLQAPALVEEVMQELEKV